MSENTSTKTPNPVKNGDVLLEVKNLKKHFVVATSFFGKPTKFLRAVDDVSFTLKKGKGSSRIFII